MVDSPCSASSEEESFHTPSFAPQKDDTYLQTLDQEVSLGTWRTLGIVYLKHSFWRWGISAQKISVTWPRTFISSMSQADLEGKCSISVCASYFPWYKLSSRGIMADYTWSHGVWEGWMRSGWHWLWMPGWVPVDNLSSSWVFIYIFPNPTPQPSKLKGVCLVNHKAIVCQLSFLSHQIDTPADPTHDNHIQLIQRYFTKCSNSHLNINSRCSHQKYRTIL